MSNFFLKEGKVDYKRVFSSSLFWLILGILISLYRWKFRLVDATLWAEDGALFLQQSLQEGVCSIIMPYAGYFHTIPRIISWIVCYFPSNVISHAFVISCFLITIYVALLILRKEYEWIFPKIYHRGMLFLLILIAPGTPEAFGNLANLHWVLYLYLGLLGIRVLDYQYKWWEILLSILVVLSEGATLTLLPLFLIRLLFQVVKKYRVKYYLQELIIIVSILVMAFVNFHIRTQLSTIHIGKEKLFDVVLHSILQDFLSHPWMSQIPYQLMGAYWFIPTLYIAVIAIMLIRRYFLWKPSTLILLGFFGCIMMIPPMIAMARTIPDVFIFHGEWGNDRYAFLISVGGYIFWVWILALSFTEKQRMFIKYLWSLLMILAIVFCYRNYRYISPHHTENFWIKNAEKIDDVRKNMNTLKITIPIQPEGLTVTIGKGNQELQVE